MGLTCALLLALATAAGPDGLAPRPGEPPRAFACRAALVPEGRDCARRCDATPGAAAAGEAHFECALACTQRTLRALASCRDGATPAAAAALASR
jgi:hypothetical protein